MAGRIEQAAATLAELYPPSDPAEPWTLSEVWSLARGEREQAEVGPDGQGELCKGCMQALLGLVQGLEAHLPEESRTRPLRTACIGHNGPARCRICVRLLVHTLSDEEIDEQTREWIERAEEVGNGDESYGLQLILEEWSARLRLVRKVDMGLAGRLMDRVEAMTKETEGVA